MVILKYFQLVLTHEVPALHVRLQLYSILYNLVKMYQFPSKYSIMTLFTCLAYSAAFVSCRQEPSCANYWCSLSRTALRLPKKAKKLDERFDALSLHYKLWSKWREFFYKLLSTAFGTLYNKKNNTWYFDALPKKFLEKAFPYYCIVCWIKFFLPFVITFLMNLFFS